jgi:tRNA(adenine34) deaminase
MLPRLTPRRRLCMVARMPPPFRSRREAYMELALAEAGEAALRDEVPVGAVVVDAATGEVLAAAGNRTEELTDATAHAEMLALREAAKAFGGARLFGCDVYVTLEPCPMCAGAIALARIRRLYYGAADPKGGGVDHGPRIFDQPTCHHRPEVYGGIDERRAAALLRDFFAAKR